MAKQKPIIWERIPRDKARRYRNSKNHNQVISRRYYDEHYGRLAEIGLTNEQYAKRNLEENPLLSAMRPRRGQKGKTPPYSKAYEKLILENARPAKYKDGIMIGSFTFEPTLYNLMMVFYTLLRVKTKRRMLYYIETEELDANGNVTHTALTRYEYLPNTKEKMINVWEEIENFDSRYGIDIRIIQVTIHYRYGV